jgi:hypothetical protein
MSRSFSILAGLILLMTSAQAIAGGPARLCLPIDGVTEKNASACGQQIATALRDKLWSDDSNQGVQLQMHQNQWYAVASLLPNADIKLTDFESALAGSDFSIPRDRLRLFGSVRLELDVSPDAEAALVNELAREFRGKAELTKRELKTLCVTFVLPYEKERDIFLSLSRAAITGSSTDSTSPADALPSYAELQHVIAKHHGRLNDISWSGAWACRVLGSVTSAKAEGQVSQLARPAITDQDR